MQSRTFLAFTSLALGAMLCSLGSSADPITWTIERHLPGGPDVSGSFTYDQETQTLSNISISTSPSPYPATSEDYGILHDNGANYTAAIDTWIDNDNGRLIGMTLRGSPVGAPELNSYYFIGYFNETLGNEAGEEPVAPPRAGYMVSLIDATDAGELACTAGTVLGVNCTLDQPGPPYGPLNVTSFRMRVGSGNHQVAAPAISLPRFSYIPLPDLQAVALNNQGQVAATWANQAYLWQNGTITSLGAGVPVDINDHGYVLGGNWLWKPGVGRLAPGFANAIALNNNTEAIGRLIPVGPPFGDQAYRWSALTGSQQLSVIEPGGWNSVTNIGVFDINDSGTIAMSWDLASGSEYGGIGFWTSPSSFTYWGGPGDCCSVSMSPASINNAGYGAGEMLAAADGPVASDLPFGEEYGCGSNGCRVAYLWTPDAIPLYLGFLGFDEDSASIGIFGLNAFNFVVGTRAEYSNFVDCCDYDVDFRAVMGSATLGLRNLDAMIDPRTPLPNGVALVKAVAINDLNQILSTGSDGKSYLLTPLPVTPDTDGDGIQNYSDNCTLLVNPNQCDSDGDGYGNRCDGDFNNNGFTNAQDSVIFRSYLGGAYNVADLNCNGAVNAQDTVLFRQRLGSPPGPSGLHP